MGRPAYITTPVGIDLPIQNLQKYLVANVSWLVDVYPKAYKNIDNQGRYTPEVYNSGNEYIDVLADDYVNAMSFFEVGDTYEIGVGLYAQTTVRLIVFAKLDIVKSTLTHRAEENLISDILYAIDKYNGEFTVTKVIKGIKNVYQNFELQHETSFTDMHPNCVFCVEMDCNFDYNNNVC